MIGSPGAAHLVDHRDEFGVHERLVPDQAERERAGRRLHDRVRRVDDDPRGLQRVEHLVDAIRDRGVDDLGGILPATGREDNEDDDACTDQKAEHQSEGHQRCGVHSD